jgi:hypothetical protein
MKITEFAEFDECLLSAPVAEWEIIYGRRDYAYPTPFNVAHIRS